MGVKFNHVIPNAHFHKHWQDRVKTWFNQPMRKARRRRQRRIKAAREFPRPVSGPLRPAVHPPSVRYNMRMRYGRGFTKAELKEAKVPLRLARTIGISVDKRRRNQSDPVYRANVNRIKEYRSRLVLFPKRGRMQLGDAPRRVRTKTKQLKKAHQFVLPIKRVTKVIERPRFVKRAEWKANAYLKLRRARLQPRQISRKKREAAAAAAGETAKGKKGKKGAKAAPAKKAAPEPTDE